MSKSCLRPFLIKPGQCTYFNLLRLTMHMFWKINKLERAISSGHVLIFSPSTIPLITSLHLFSFSDPGTYHLHLGLSLAKHLASLAIPLTFLTKLEVSLGKLISSFLMKPHRLDILIRKYILDTLLLYSIYFQSTPCQNT